MGIVTQGSLSVRIETSHDHARTLDVIGRVFPVDGTGIFADLDLSVRQALIDGLSGKFTVLVSVHLATILFDDDA